MKVRICLFVLLAIAYRQSIASPAIPVHGNNVDLSTGVSFYQSEYPIDAATALRFYLHGKFTATGPTVQAGYSDRDLWIAIPLFNRSSYTSWILEIANPHINEITLFTYFNDQVDSLGFGGDMVPFHNRIAENRYHQFAFQLNAEQGRTLLLRVRDKGHTTLVPLAIRESSYQSQVSERGYLMWGMLTGALTFIAVFALLIYFFVRLPRYLFYALSVISGIVWIWSRNGLGYQYLWPEFPLTQAKSAFVAGELGIVLYLHMMQLLLGQARDNSRWFRPVQVVKFALLASIGMLLIPVDFRQWATAITIAMIFVDLLSLSAIYLLFVSIIEKIRQKNQLAALYLLAMTISFSAIVVLFLTRLNLVPANSFTIHFPNVGMITEMLMMAGLLSYHYKKERDQKEAMALQLKNQEIDSAVQLALAREAERKRIAADMHDDLGASLSGLQLMSELSARKTSAEDLRTDIHRIHASTRELSMKVKDIVWTLDPNNDSLENLLLYIHQMGHQVFDETRIAFHVSIPEEIPSTTIRGTARKQILFALKEAFANVLKHAEANRCTCEFSIDSQLTIRVSDNGRGFDVNGITTIGNGLRNMRQRMGVISGAVEWEVSDGTTVAFRIPLQAISTRKGN